MLTPQQQHELYQLGFTRLERKLLVKAGTARNAFIRVAASAYDSTHTLPSHVSVSHRNRIKATLENHYSETATYYGRLVRQSLKGRKAQMLTPVELLVADFARKQAARKAQMIADTDRDDIVSAITEGIAAGEGTAQIATRIRKIQGMTPYRASVIARTETNAAATYGSIESAREAEDKLEVKLLKQWLPTLDARTRDAHAAMAGYPAIPLDEQFIVDGEAMDRPGDASASAGNVVQCRCSIVYLEAS